MAKTSWNALFLWLLICSCAASCGGCGSCEPGDQRTGSRTKAAGRAPDGTRAPRRERLPKERLVLRLRILSLVPIGWGTNYSCHVEDVMGGKLGNARVAFSWTASVGSELSSKIHLLQVGATFVARFAATDRRSATTYSPAGLTGFVDAKRRIWELVSIAPDRRGLPVPPSVPPSAPPG